MAGSATTELRVKVGVTGDKNLTRLSRSLSNLGRDTAKANFNFKRFTAVLQEKERRSVKSVNTTRQFSAAWKELANSVRIGSNEFKIATAEAKRLDAQLAKTQAKRGGGIAGMARTAGAVAAGGIFGGPEGAIGAGIGGVMGGPAGAAVGAAVGAQVSMARQSIASTAEYSAALGLQRKALRLVINDTKAYADSQRFLEDRSKRLAIPQDVIVRQFTALTASVKGAGKSVEDAEKVFESIAAGIRGTGGSLEDMKAAMRATSQVFSKGKVSAEELRQQLGERLPGAFTIFAESMNRTPAQLDKMLEQGQVTLDDFMKFSETLFKKYGENAEILASGPEAAGDRLAVAMSQLKDNVGQILRPAGALFQNIIEENMISPLARLTKNLKDFLKIGSKFTKEQLEAERRLLAGLQKQRELIPSQYPGLAERDPGRYAAIISDKDLEIAKQQKKVNDLRIKYAELNDEIGNNVKKTEEMGQTGNKVWEMLKAGALSYKNSIKSVAEQISDAMTNAFESMTDALTEFVMTGKMNFSDFARSVINDLTRIFIRSQILNIFDFLGGSAKGSAIQPRPRLQREAKGGVYANGIRAFAKGGVVNSPHIFPFKNGIGLMGEAGPEAIMPLRRGAGGRLGVEASGGGTSVVVNVDASGSTVEGDAQEARNLGKAISSAVQQELVRQRRPGGLLSA
jgi:tape measure domain-containing protein